MGINSNLMTYFHLWKPKHKLNEQVLLTLGRECTEGVMSNCKYLANHFSNSVIVS